jgi:hypothetical protein
MGGFKDSHSRPIEHSERAFTLETERSLAQVRRILKRQTEKPFNEWAAVWHRRKIVVRGRIHARSARIRISRMDASHSQFEVIVVQLALAPSSGRTIVKAEVTPSLLGLGVGTPVLAALEWAGLSLLLSITGFFSIPIFSPVWLWVTGLVLTLCVELRRHLRYLRWAMPEQVAETWLREILAVAPGV